MRYSHQRELIKNILKNRYDHPTAEDVYISAKQIEKSISLGTVYRNLGELVKDGQAISIETEDKKVRYDGRVGYHTHFVCENCGKVFDLFNELAIPKEISEQGFMVNQTKTVYYGQCPECNIKNN